ncbi:MAG: hypothetical protein ACKOCA_00680 [Vulcanococcus sp.]
MPEFDDRWEPRRRPRSGGRPEGRSEGQGRAEPRLEQRLDQWMSAGRQLVDGVAGTRPGSRSGGEGRAAGGLRLNQVGRWVETKLDWLLEDDEGWRESWEEPQAPRRQLEPRGADQSSRPRRQPLQAISRRAVPRDVAPQADPAQPQDWPDADSFTVNRWSRSSAPQRPPVASDQAASRPLGRALPRSSRRRFDDPS